MELTPDPRWLLPHEQARLLRNDTEELIATLYELAEMRKAAAVVFPYAATRCGELRDIVLGGIRR